MGLQLLPCVRPELMLKFIAKDDQTRIIKAQCGHDRYEHDRFQINDQFLDTSPKPRFTAWQWWRSQRLGWRPKLCQNCEGERSFQEIIVCAMCGEPIFVNNPVSTYGIRGGTDENLPWLKYATRLADSPDIFVACLGMNCCPSAGFFAGHWNGSGVVSLYRTGTAAGDMLSGALSETHVINP